MSVVVTHHGWSLKTINVLPYFAQMISKYSYIAIEGNIGSGKTSLAKMIARDYNARLVLERFEDNSFLPKFYKNPKKYAFPLEMSFLAERFQQLKEEITTHDLFKSFTIADYCSCPRNCCLIIYNSFKSASASQSIPV